jgi:catalase-peroxidase
MDWWPNALNLDILHQHDARPTRWAPASTIARSVKKLDVEALKKDLHA